MEEVQINGKTIEISEQDTSKDIENKIEEVKWSDSINCNELFNHIDKLHEDSIDAKIKEQERFNNAVNDMYSNDKLKEQKTREILTKEFGLYLDGNSKKMLPNLQTINERKKIKEKSNEYFKRFY